MDSIPAAPEGTHLDRDHRPASPRRQLDGATALLEALQFAAARHATQRRKDAAQTPYINHPIAVAAQLAGAGGVSDPTLLQAAILHDTVEDTDTTLEQLEACFGKAVSDLVAEVTDDKSLEKARRKQLQVEHAPHLSPAAKQLKVADKTCNLRDIQPHQPVGWELPRKLEYLDWAERVVAGCRGCNPALEAAFDEVLRERRQALTPAV